jgi:hypothetical protein
MPVYRVKWEIDTEADSPIEAAEKALRIQRDPDSIATVFQVQIEGSAFFDLWDEIEVLSARPGLD